LKFSYVVGKGINVARGFEWFATEFGKRTNGRYKVDTYPGSTLVPIPGALEATKSGVADIVMTSTGTFPKLFPLSMVASLPTMNFPMGNEAAYSSAFQAFWDLYNSSPEVQAEYKDFKLLWPFTLEPYSLVTKKKEVHMPADLQGLRVGGVGFAANLLTANGAAPVNMVSPDAYMNLDKGIVDGAFISFSLIGSLHLNEVANYFYTQDFGGGTLIIIMNQNSWNSMSADDQKLMMDTWKDASVEGAKGMMADTESAKKAITDSGKKVTAPTQAEIAAWQTAADVCLKAWASDAQATGVKADVVNKVLDTWKSLRTKYMK